MSNFMEVMMNPVRQRITQYLLLHPESTPGDMLKAMPDIPTASLYRHVRVLLEAGLIEVVQEEKVRGAVRRSYRLVQQPKGMEETDLPKIFRSGMLSLLSTFERYFARPDHDARRDGLGISVSTLMLTDAELIEYLTQINALTMELVSNSAAPGRKPRSICLISAPAEGAGRTPTEHRI